MRDMARNHLHVRLLRLYLFWGFAGSASSDGGRTPCEDKRSFNWLANTFICSLEIRISPSRTTIRLPDPCSRSMRCVLERSIYIKILRLQPARQPAQQDQKLNVACRSSLRFAPPVENGPPCKALAESKNGEPRIPLGFARLTLFRTLRTETPRVRL